MSIFVSRIEPPSGFSLGFRELWRYRELFYFFTWRDIKVKYKQTYLGILWAILQPLGMMLIFSFLFTKTWKIDTGTIKYPVFVLAGLALWNFFSASVSHASESMIKHAGIINKIYFPRLIIPSSSILVAFFDFLIGFILFFVFAIIYNQNIDWTAIIYFPAAILIVFFASFGTGTFLSALNVKYRDFRYTIPFFLQFLFFASQVIYPISLIENKTLKYLLALNPVNAAIELFRKPLSGLPVDWNVIWIGLGSAMLITTIGIYYFRKTEAYFADLS